MAATTTLLGLVTPTQGTLSGTWGDTVNYGISDYVDISVAGTLTLTNDGAVTLANTTGSSSGNNITSTLTGAGTVTAQFAIVRVTGTLTVAKVVTGPSYSKTYTVVNAATGGIVTFKASGQTGVSVAVGESALVYFNGTDYVKLVGTATAGAAGGSTTQVQFNSSGVLAGSANLTFDGTTFSAPNSVITSSSSSAALRITQTGAGNALLVEDSANPDSTPFVGDTSGNVVIGTVATESLIGNTPLQVIGDGGAANIGFVRYQTGSNFAPTLTIARSNNTKASPSIVVSQDYLGTVAFSGFDGTAFRQGALIRAEVDGTPGASDMPGRLYFATTADGASTPTERMRIDSAGQVGIGGSPSSGSTVWNIKNITGSTTSIAYDAVGTVMSDVTTSASGYRTSISTTASAFTLSSLNHFSANQSTIGASSAVTNQIGFNVGSSLTGATNNYGFYGSIASGTNRYNLYMAGTADNYLGGSLGIGSAGLTGVTLLISKNITGAVFAFGTHNTSTIQSDVTSAAYGYSSQPSTQATSFTLPNLIHFIASQGTIGAGSTVTNQYGFYANSPMTGATNNYGFFGNIASGTGRWNFYAAGTAQNYFAGNVGIATTSPGSALDVKGTLRLSGSTSGYVGLAPAAAAGSTTYTLPSADGTSGQFLSTNGSGTLSWATGGSGSSQWTTSGSDIFYNTGNVAVGSAPQTYSLGKALEVGFAGNGINGASQTQVTFIGNAYYNSGWKYGGTGKAAFMQIDAGAILWYNTDTSGTAGASISTFAERMRITSAGDVGIGTSSPGAKLDVAGSAYVRGDSSNATFTSAGQLAIKRSSGDPVLSFHGNTGTQIGNIQFQDAGVCSINVAVTQALVFKTNNTESARITSSGDFLVGTTSASGRARIVQSNNDKVLTVENTAASPSAASTLLYLNQSTATTTPFAIQYYSAAFGGAVRFQVLGDGNVQNTNNSYGAISDIKLKENIVDATPKLADLMQVKVRNYNLKSDPTQKQIGVIAQELEQVFPNMVEEQVDHDAKGNDFGTTTKSVKYSVFVPMLIKAMQEQQEIIESLKARLDAANL